MTWTYKQSTGELRDATGRLMGQGYSGVGIGLNCPARDCLHCVGPIPKGLWKQGEPFSSAKHGPFCIPLEPELGTDTHGRDSFMMHGDRIDGPPYSASEGCIIMQRIVRNQFAASGEMLEVVE